MHEINILDNELKKISIEDCLISILVSPDGYCFSIKDGRQNRFMSLRCIPSEEFSDVDIVNEKKKLISEIWNSNSKIKCDNIVYAVKEALVLPKVFSDSENKKEIMNFNFPDYSVNNEIISVTFDRENIVLSGLVNKEINQKLVSEFNPATTTFNSAGLIQSAINNTFGKIDDVVYVSVWHEYIEIVAVKNKNIVLFNTYKCKKDNDIVYFILNAYKQLMLDPVKCRLMFSGWMEKDSSAVVQLNKFIKNIYFETLNPDNKYSYHFQDSLPHYFVNFLNIS